MKLDIIYGDITDSKVDVVVNSANSYLRKEGGVGGDIYDACEHSFDLEYECKKIGYVKPGDAVMTNGYNLSKYIIHAVGPIYQGTEEDATILKNAYENSLKLADEKGLKTIAFPLISIGYNGYPLKEGVKIALNTLGSFKAKNLETCELYCYLRTSYLVTGSTWLLMQ